MYELADNESVLTLRVKTLCGVVSPALKTVVFPTEAVRIECVGGAANHEYQKLKE